MLTVHCKALVQCHTKMAISVQSEAGLRVLEPLSEKHGKTPAYYNSVRQLLTLQGRMVSVYTGKNGFVFVGGDCVTISFS